TFRAPEGEGGRAVSRAMRPPGGEPSDRPEAAAPPRRPNRMASNIFGPTEEPQNIPKGTKPLCFMFGNCNHCCFCCGHPCTMLGVSLFMSCKNKNKIKKKNKAFERKPKTTRPLLWDRRARHTETLAGWGGGYLDRSLRS
uniref:Uncharacterized protein n=1 Tax=Balaenoptera musculus TaxID=9771 RepID=A0A8C0CYJ5_BALMU